MVELSFSLVMDRLAVIANCLIAFARRKTEFFICFFSCLDLCHLKNDLTRVFYSARGLPSHTPKNSSTVNHNGTKYRIILLRNKIKNA